jgi:hypothetical protein
MTKRFKSQSIPNQKTGRDYMVDLNRLPAAERDRFRAARGR